SVSKNFLWDRQFAITWNFTKSLSMSLNTQTTAHILEPIGQVNKKLFPDEYRDWKDSVWRSIKSLGTPWAYHQTFTASYKAPFNAIPFLSFITANASYNATYNWERGATIDGAFSGHTIANQSSLNLDGRLNLDQFYNKVPYLKDVNKRFSSSGGGTSRDTKNTKKPKKFNRAFKLNADTTLVVKHNMNVKKVRVTATTSDGKRFPVKYEIKDDNTIEILNKGSDNIKLTITELSGGDKKNFWSEFAQYTTRFAMMVKSVNVKFRSTRSLSLPQFKPEIGDIFGQSTHYDVMSPGLDFAFGFTDESYINKAKERGWLLCDESMTSPALFAKTQEFSAEVQLEPIRGLKITLTGNRTDSRTTQLQFMFDDMSAVYSGSYTKTHMAIATALRGVSADDGYHSDAFDKFLENIPVVAQRIESQYYGKSYPSAGFIGGTIYANAEFNPENGSVNPMSSDVLIPAFMAAYSGKNAKKVTLNPFPSIKEILPNWRVTYDGLTKLPFFSKHFKSFTLTHAYQCTYSVGSYSSYSDWVTIGEGLGFTQNALTSAPVPSSPYNISSVTITEKFAPLIGVNATLNNNLTLNAEYRDSRTLSLNSSAGQVVEALSKSFVIGAGFKIANFNSILKIKSKQQGVSNDLTLKFDFQYSNNTALIRKIDVNTTQATSGTKTLSINFSANYVMSKRITIGAYFDHQVNTPLVSSNAYPTTNSNYGISLNMSLAK
ncbi:MAG: cell surface protein SprA, partial [Muribaculaceae bacterium]|nr:cell surface protein SprA [Muribaculaceae bacterium]